MTTNFTELFKLPVADNRDIVVSDVVEDGMSKGININSYVTTGKYTGFTKGTFIPKDKIHDFISGMRNLDI